jgi:hypothetical protein
MPDERDLWGDFSDTPPLITPLAIMKEQAALLGDKTKGLLRASVDTTAEYGEITHYFHIVASALGNYEYQLFYAKHAIELYPVKIEYKLSTIRCDDVTEFTNELGKILASPETHRIVQSLIAQSLA